MMYLYGNIPDCSSVTSIPLHPKRQSHRGFNQAEEIAVELARLLQLQYIPCLQRVKHSTNLASVSDPLQRRAVIENQFEVLVGMKQYPVPGPVLIVDDVWTTSATLEEASKVLKSLVSSPIHGYTFAHGQ